MKQNKPKVVGITGGIATGKSTVSKIIKNLGYEVIDADVISREVVEKGKPAYRELIAYFGDVILDEYGNIDRKELGNLIFNDEEKRKKLNSITHPYIMKAIKESIDNKKEQKIIFVDIPLLIEEMDKLRDYDIRFDEIWLVYVDEENQIDRLMKRDCIDRTEALNKISAQMPIEIKKKYASIVIDNRGDIKDLDEQVRRFIEKSIKNLEG